MNPGVFITRDDAVATVTLENSGKLNALTLAMWQRLTRVMDELSADDGLAALLPLVARWHKKFVRRLTAPPEPLTAAEIDANFTYFETEDYRIGYDAFMNKRKPKFVGR